MEATVVGALVGALIGGAAVLIRWAMVHIGRRRSRASRRAQNAQIKRGFARLSDFDK